MTSNASCPAVRGGKDAKRWGRAPRRRRARLLATLAIAIAIASAIAIVALVGRAPTTPDPGTGPGDVHRALPAPTSAPVAPRAPPVPRPQVLAEVPHDPAAFTQGLEASDGVLLEGTGLQGRSQLRELDPATGAVRRAVDMPPELFGEGITVDDDTIWQLTWTDRVALARDRSTLAITRTVALDGEGWGICHDPGGAEPRSGDRGGRLVTSDGSEHLTVRDRNTFAPTATIRVTAADQPVDGLNELECTAEGIWANVWPTNHLVRIDPATGTVTARVDASGLLPPAQRAGADVLNGIAAIPGTDQYWLTGKFWPTTFRVRFTL